MSLTRVIRPNFLGLRAKRLGMEGEFVVEAKTIGTIMSYHLGTENVSRTGLLLNGGRYRKIPYRVNTILELTVDPHGAMLDKPVNLLGKVVRMATTPGGRPTYGIHIVQMDQKDIETWEKVMTRLEATLPEIQEALPAAV